MTKSSIDPALSVDEILGRARAAGFCSAGILDGKELQAQDRLAGASAVLVVALPYGNGPVRAEPGPEAPGPGMAGGAIPPVFGRIAPFARRDYYGEAVFRLRNLARCLREDYGGRKADYRILCNSRTPEKPLAEAARIGQVGRNSLILTKEAGSLAVLAALTLPFRVSIYGRSGFSAESEPFSACRCCLTAGGDPAPACATACPTGALPGDGTLILIKCVQWYASGHGERVPDAVAEAWGDRFYGCTECQDACPHNHRPIPSADTQRGPLGEYVDVGELLALGDDGLRSLFRGTALGLAWLGPAALRRNAELVLRALTSYGKQP